MPSLLQRLKGLFGITFGGAGADTWQFSRDWVKGLFVTPGPIDKPYAQHAAVAIAMERIAMDAASVEWEFFAEGDEERETPLDHPLLDLWMRPNATMVGTDLWVASYLSYLHWGEFFWWYPDVQLGARGGPQATARNSGEIMVLDPRAVMHKVTPEGDVEFRLRRSDGDEMVLEMDRLTHGKRHNPYDPGSIRGLSKLDAIRVEILGDSGAASWNSRYFNEQNAIPSGVLSPPVGTMPTKDQKDELRRSMMQRHGGTKRSVMMVPPGWSFEALGVTHDRMDFKELRLFSRDQILSMIGPVPPLIAGFLDVTIKYNAQEQKEIYWLGTITSFLGQIQQIVNHKFLHSLGIEGIEVWPRWETVKMMVENFDAKVDTATKLFAIGFPKSQINDRLELGFDVDALEDGDTGYLPLNLVPVGQEFVPPPVASVPGETGTTEEEVRALADGGAREQRRTLVWRNIIARTSDLEAQFARVFRSHFEEIRREALSNLSDVEGRAWRCGAVLKQEGGPLVFDVDEASRRLRRRTDSIHRAAVKRGGETVLADLAFGLNFDLDDPTVLAKLAEMSLNIKGINERLEFALRTALIDAIGEQGTIDDLRDAVAQVIDVSLGRARTIARTETGFAFNSGRNLSMRQAGIRRHEWLSSRDADVRDTHTVEDGNQVVIGEAFPATGLLYPNDPSGPPGEVINCRCVAVPVVER